MGLAELISQLSPDKRNLAIMLIKQLAEQDGIIASDIVQANGIKCPADAIPRWVVKLKLEGKSCKSPRTLTH